MGKKTPTITITPMVVTYNGQAISAPTVTTDSDGNVTYTYYKDGVALQDAPMDAGSYTVVVEIQEGTNYLAGSTTGTITINRYSVRLAWDNLYQPYTGSVLSPSVNIAYLTPDQIGVNVIVAGMPINVGTYACTATLTGAKADNYEIASGYETNTLTITKMQIVVGPISMTYDGTDKWPSNTGYVTYSGAGTAINAGTYQVTASLLDTQNTEWSDHTTADKTLTLTINAANISSCTVTGIDASYSYTGSAITPSPTVTFGGDTLVEDTDYTVSYSNNINADTAYVIITGIGNFTGTTTVTFEIIGVSQLDFSGLSSLTPRFARISNKSYTILSEQPSYNHNNEYVVRLVPSASMTVADFVTMFPASQQPYIVMLNTNRSIISTSAYGSTTLTTGMEICLVNNNTIYDDFYIALSGDLNSDGVANSIDNNLLKRYLRGSQMLSATQLVAADRNWDGVVNALDNSTWTNWG